jgi:ABC-type Fe3+/spermidine/putrescine transport system ATPase subunit
VAENVAFGLRMQGLPAAEQQRRTAEALALVHMQDFAARRVDDLSGGEQQRVALARSLAPRPRLLMLDEPLGALDHQLRERLLVEVREILRAANIPAIYVTHDHEEAFAIADRLVLLRDGRVEQSGTPTAVFQQPGSAWVAAFFGMGTLLEAVLDCRADTPQAHTALGTLCLDPAYCTGLADGETVRLLLRPEDALPGEGENALTVRVTDLRFAGERFLLWVEAGSGIHLQLTSTEPMAIGAECRVHYPPHALLPLRNGDPAQG